MKKLDDYDLYIWDLDGTLYYQPTFRKKMMLVLLQGLILKPAKYKELYIIWQYRKVREKWDPDDTGDDLDTRQYKKTANICHSSPQKVRQTIEYWMLEVPNVHLKTYRDDIAAGLIKKLQKEGKTVVVWSDYPVDAKLRALDIHAADSICSTDISVGAMKPNPKGINVILEKYRIPKEKVLMIGDREEKDGLAAKNAGVDSLILKRTKKEREGQYNKLGLGL